METYISYHVSEDGNARQCYAPPGECPLAKRLGVDLPHFRTKQEAQQWYEDNHDDDLFPVYTTPGLIVQDFEEGIKTDEYGQQVSHDTLTDLEMRAIDAMDDNERVIAAHQEKVARGVDTYSIYNEPDVDFYVEGYLDMHAYRQAFLNGDYDEARRVFARAAISAYNIDNSVHLSVDDLVDRVR